MAPPLRTWPLLLALAFPAAAVPASHPNAQSACDTLAAALHTLVVPPTSPAYAQHNHYWSARQSEVQPACFVVPRTSGDVATAVAILTRDGVPFSVKSGGHTAFAGGSNAQGGGVTLDLARLDEVVVSGDRRTVAVGAGNRWIDVSEVLDPLGLAVVGGRSATVGVSGLVLGGGISYLSGERGWACDNVRSFEVVLASGAIVRASTQENQDLYWALRGGGGSNFGVVTRFELAAYEQGPMWGSAQIFPGAVNATLIPVMHDLLVGGLAADPAAHTYFVLSHSAALGGYILISHQFHLSHTDLASPPAAFAPFHNAALPALITDTRLSNISQLSRDIEIAAGLRQTWWATSVAATATPELLFDIARLYQVNAERLLAAAAADNTSLHPYLVFQAITTNVLEAMQVNGGNALGLKPEDGPFMLIQTSAEWSSSALDGLVDSSLEQLIRDIDALAASHQATTKNGFIYMNYAGKTQDVLGSYGQENRDRLKQIAKKYDPQDKLRNLWTGYFKV